MNPVRFLCQQPDPSRRERQVRAQSTLEQAQDILSLSPGELRQKWVYSEVGLQKRNRIRRLGLAAGILSGAALGTVGGWAGTLVGGLVGGSLGLLVPRALEWNQRERGIQKALGFYREQARVAQQELASAQPHEAPESSLGRLEAGLVVGGILLRRRSS